MEYHTLHKTVVMKMAGKSAGSLVLELYTALCNVFLASSLTVIYIFFSLKSPSFCSASLILSSVFTLLLVSILHHPERHTFSISPAVKCEESEQILQCLHANISPLECWKINKQPSIQGQRDTSTKERKQRGV